MWVLGTKHRSSHCLASSLATEQPPKPPWSSFYGAAVFSSAIMDAATVCVSTHILKNLVEFEDKWAGIGENHEKKEFNIRYLSNLITACFQAELNSGRQVLVLFTVTNYILICSKWQHSSGLFPTSHNEEKPLKCYCLVINVSHVTTASSN